MQQGSLDGCTEAPIAHVLNLARKVGIISDDSVSNLLDDLRGGLRDEVALEAAVLASYLHVVSED